MFFTLKVDQTRKHDLSQLILLADVGFMSVANKSVKIAAILNKESIR